MEGTYGRSLRDLYILLGTILDRIEHFDEAITNSTAWRQLTKDLHQVLYFPMEHYRYGKGITEAWIQIYGAGLKNFEAHFVVPLEQTIPGSESWLPHYGMPAPGYEAAHLPTQFPEQLFMHQSDVLWYLSTLYLGKDGFEAMYPKVVTLFERIAVSTRERDERWVKQLHYLQRKKQALGSW